MPPSTGAVTSQDERPRESQARLDTPPDAAATPEQSRATPDVELPLPEDAHWYTAQDLDQYPRPLVPLQLRPPADAGEVAGEVVVLLAIDASGRLVERKVVDAQPPATFDAVALAAFDGVAFAPALREGRPVRSRMLVKLRFSAAPEAAREVAGGDDHADAPAGSDSATAR